LFRILFAFAFIVGSAGAASAQPQACVLDCLAKNEFCQTPCFEAVTKSRAACAPKDRKCVRAAKSAQRACVKPCSAEYRTCATACNKRRPS
jgi:hypothetical protein